MSRPDPTTPESLSGTVKRVDSMIRRKSTEVSVFKELEDDGPFVFTRLQNFRKIKT